MTDLELSKIKQPSKLIRIALGDLEKAEKAKAYTINMNDWHEPRGSKCSVCFAGSVMAFSLNDNMNQIMEPHHHTSENQLGAINKLRLGDVASALERLGLEEVADCDREVIDYIKNPKLFKKQMKQLATDLEKDNL